MYVVYEDFRDALISLGLMGWADESGYDVSFKGNQASPVFGYR